MLPVWLRTRASRVISTCCWGAVYLERLQLGMEVCVWMYVYVYFLMFFFPPWWTFKRLLFIFVPLGPTPPLNFPPHHQPSPRLPFWTEFLVGPLVLIELGVVVGLAVLHGDAARQDGGHVVAHRLPLGLLLPLLLYLPQLDTWRVRRKRRGDVLISL